MHDFKRLGTVANHTGGAGADTLSGGDGDDDFIQTDQVADATTVDADTITDFNDNGTDQVGNFSVANLETLTALTDLISIDAASASVGPEAVVTDEVAGTTDAATLNTGTNLLLLDDNLADTDAVETALETGGDLALTANEAIAADDGFLVAYDDDTDTNIALVTSAAGVADNALAAANDLTAVNLVTLTGVGDATTLGDGNFLDYLA